MSYILDALNKADSERERQRSAVPGLQSYADVEHGASSGNVWRWVALAAIVLLAAVLAWLWLGRDEPAPAVAAAAPAMPMPTPAPTPMPAPPPAPSPMPQAVPPPTVAAAPAAVAPPSPPVAIVKPPSPPAAVPKPVPAASAAARLPTRDELPPELRAALPPIAVSGAVYAPSPKDRLLFANGLVLKEGDALADGLTVERIGASSSVLVLRGQRFELKH